MIHKVYTVYDSKAEAYLFPISYQSKGQAVRAFSEAANDKNSNIGKYPEDFTMFELGEFDDVDCSFKFHKAPVAVGVAIEYLNS